MDGPHAPGALRRAAAFVSGHVPDTKAHLFGQDIQTGARRINNYCASVWWRPTVLEMPMYCHIHSAFCAPAATTSRPLVMLFRDSLRPMR